MKGAGEALIVEKKSKFIATVIPVENEEEALSFLQEMRSKYSDATHNVYAYIIDENNIFRYSDDGEPGGTAGMPTLDTIRKEGIVDVAVVVTRYFGGILLGGGGLVRAYSHGAAIAVEGAEILNMRLCKVFTVDADYTLYGKISRMLPKFNIQQQNIEFGSSVVLTLAALPDDYAAFGKELTEISAGAIVPQLIEEKYLNKN